MTTPDSFQNAIDLIYIICARTIQITIQSNADGTLDAYRGFSAALLGTSTFAFSASNKYYVEFKFVIADGTGGSVEMKVADITAGGDDAETAVEWTITNVDTKETTSALETSWDQIELRGWGAALSPVVYDDIVVLDGNGPNNSDYLGNVTVETINPNGSGSSTQLVPSTGNNWENVDDPTTPDGDATYNEADADGETDLYAMTSLAGPGEIAAVQAQVLTRVTEGDPRKIRIPVREGTTTEEGGDFTCLNDDDYRGRHRVVEENPNTSALWTNGEVNDMEVGIKRQS